MTLCVVNEGGMPKVIMQGDTNKGTWFDFKDDGTIRCKHGYLDGNVKAGTKRKFAADILCWKHHGKSNQQWTALVRHVLHVPVSRRFLVAPLDDQVLH